MDIRHVLVPVDFSTTTDREIGLAVEVCRAFGARLVLHHNQHGAPPGMARAWDWEEHHRATQGRNGHVERELRALAARIPTDVAVDATVTRGVCVPAILTLARALPADLIIIGSHGADTDDHSSVAERLIAQAPCPVLALQEGVDKDAPLNLVGGRAAAVVVPTDLTPASRTLLGYVFALARRLPVKLRLLHVVPAQRLVGAALNDLTGSVAPQTTETKAALAELEALVPADLRDRIECTVDVGAPVGQIVDACSAADFLVMGEHAKGLRGLFTHDTARDVLRHAPCPVWFVPPQVTSPQRA